MAYFRRRIRRQPWRRKRFYRRRYPLRRRRLRRSTTGTHKFKFTKIEYLAVDFRKSSAANFFFTGTEWPEFQNIYNNFEYYKFNRARVRVIPRQSVSNNSSSLVPSYALLPWHRTPPALTDFQTYCSVDKAKIYRMTERSQMSFVPNTLTPATSTTPEVIQWKPKCIVPSAGALPTHYCGMIVTQEQDGLTEATFARFTIVRDIWVSFWGQKSLTLH